MAESYLELTADVDRDDNMGNAAGGIHLGAQGSLWQAVVFGFLGVRLTNDALILQPRLANSWARIRCPLHWRERRLIVTIDATPSTWNVTLDSGDNVYLVESGGSPVKLDMAISSAALACGQSVRITETAV